MNKRALVTGAAGFIGSHLVEQLVRTGYEVRAFVHYNGSGHLHNLTQLPADVLKSIEVMAGDIVDPYSVDRAVVGSDVVFHLASLIAIPYSYRAPAAYVATNVSGTLHVLQACRQHETPRVVHTSTSEVYGTAQYTPMDEQHPLVGQSPYSASKIAADKLAESFHCSYGLPVVTVRPFNTFGPRQSARAVIPAIVAQALGRGRVDIGSLDPVRDFTFVRDTAAGFIAASRCDDAVGQTVNLGTGKGVSIGQVIELVFEKLGRRLEIHTDSARLRPERSEVRRLICNNALMTKLTRWRPEVSLADGLDEVIAYISERPELYRPEEYHV